MLFRSGIAVVLFNLGKIAVHTGLRAVQRVGYILDRALQQEDTAVFKRSNDLHALVRRETVGGHAEADELGTLPTVLFLESVEAICELKDKIKL